MAANSFGTILPSTKAFLQNTITTITINTCQIAPGKLVTTSRIPHPPSVGYLLKYRMPPHLASQAPSSAAI